MLTTDDGYSWTAGSGTKSGGLKCVGVVSPELWKGKAAPYIYDSIVVGAGYAGLVAARDLSERGKSTLLLEARDRVGGRTYTVEENGELLSLLYEMGGTWVTHHMGYLFKEMVRYNLDRDLILTHHQGYENDYYTMQVPGAPSRQMSHKEAGQIMTKAWDTFVNVDGNFCRTICPLPHAQLTNIMVSREIVEEIDKRSCADRFEEIKDQLGPEEQALLVALLLHISGGTMQNSSLWDMIRSHALMTHSSLNFGDIWTTYKLRQGQSHMAMTMLKDAVSYGLEYAFRTPIVSIIDKSTVGKPLVEVQTANGKHFLAHTVICTVPLNVLRTVRFSPSLSARRQEAISIGHVNFMTKIHAEVRGSGLASWNGMKFPGNIMFGYGDGVHPNGNAHVVGFGKDERDTFVPERDPEKVVAAFKDLHPMDIKKTVFHNWITDPWSQGGPAWWPPEFMSKYQDELQSRHGNVFFASGDWAHGWRASIDGALEQGVLAAQEVFRELRKLGPQETGPWTDTC